MPDPDPKRAGKDPLKSGLFTVTFEVGDDIKGATNTYAYRGIERGLVGFQWSRVKFEVRNLQITGILDKKAAADILREKLKLPKKGTKVVETKEKSADKGAGGDPGGDDGSDPTADDDTS